MAGCFCTGRCLEICEKCKTKKGCRSDCACTEISKRIKNIFQLYVEQPDDDIRWYSVDFSIDTDEYLIDDTKPIKQGAD